MSFSAAWKGKDNKIYFYQGTADAGSFEREAKKTDKLASFFNFDTEKKSTKIKPYRKISSLSPYAESAKQEKIPIYTRASLIKSYPEYIQVTEGYKSSTFNPKLDGWEAEDFQGNKWKLNFRGKKLIKKPLKRIVVRRKDGVHQRYWKKLKPFWR